MARVIALMSHMRYDLKSTEEYGDLAYILDRTVSPFKTFLAIEELTHGLDAIGYDPEEDYFIMAGPTILLAFAFSILMAHHGTVRVLLYDSVRETYIPREVSLEVVA